jgi:PAS domain S-box-containing protein
MADTSQPTILLVDDRESNRYAVSRILQKARFAVREAGTGAEAMRLASEKPDLIILDINLPDTTGYEVCRQLKADPRTAAIPVLHLSASMVQSENRSQGLEMGADGYLVYPLEPRELVATVQALLRVRLAEREARARRELLQVTLSSIGDGVVATDTRGVVTFLNPVASELIGWGAEAVGKPLKEIFHIVNEDSGLPAVNPVDKVLESGRVAGLANHSLLIARDGSRRPIDDTAAPILDGEGRFVGVVLVFRDITERRRMESELQRRSEDLVERDRRKDEFLAMLAHELRGPLAPVRNTVQILRMQVPDNPNVASAVAVMDRQLDHLVRLVDDLMDISRISRGKFELRRERLELAGIVSRAVDAARGIMNERGHRLEVTLPAEPIRLEADPARLEQVVFNLLSNAAKYTPPGGRVRLAAGREGADAVVRVTDNGIGIRPQALPRLFDLFHQADRVPGQVSEGLGIGLTLVRTLVEMHGGSVMASSPGAGQGSEFVVRLPAPPAESRAAPTQATIAHRATANPRRILITDDNQDSAESLAGILRINGHDVRTAYDGSRALEIASEFRPEVLFLDIGLPGGLDGYEVARRLRQRPEGSKSMLVALSGYGQEADRKKSQAAGFDHHLVKPADPQEIQRLLAGRDSRDP